MNPAVTGSKQEKHAKAGENEQTCGFGYGITQHEK